MIEDYYKILDLKPDAGQQRIALHYLKLANKYYALISENKKYKDDFFCTNRAIEVLKNELIKKYYDILYYEQLNHGLDPDNQAIQRYLSIVDTGISNGNHKAESLLNDSVYFAKSGIIQSKKTFWLKFLVFINPLFLWKYLLIPCLLLIYLIVGVVIIFMQFQNYNSDYLFIGILMTIFSLSILPINFNCYILSKINK